MLMIWRGYGWATLIVFGITWVACLLAMQGIMEAEYHKLHLDNGCHATHRPRHFLSRRL